MSEAHSLASTSRQNESKKKTLSEKSSLVYYHMLCDQHFNCILNSASVASILKSNINHRQLSQFDLNNTFNNKHCNFLLILYMTFTKNVSLICKPVVAVSRKTSLRQHEEETRTGTPDSVNINNSFL